MNDDDVQELIDSQERRLRSTTSAFHRALYNEIDWNDRLICIKGPRGTGKTTMLVQRIKESMPDPSKALYVSLDNLWFSTHRVQDLATWLDSHGGTHLFLDEVHHFEKWQTLVKNLHDDFPSLHIVYSGSSLLQLEKGGGDLSRRQLPYILNGLSFREFLSFEGSIDIPVMGLDELLQRHASTARDIAAKVKILPLFSRYLRTGYYPFYKESASGYHERIRNVVDQILEIDYPRTEPVTVATIRKARKMLMVLASSVPQVPRMAELWRELETDRNNGLGMLNALERAGLLGLIPSRKSTLKNLSRPEKIYCDNPNLMHALVRRPDAGTVRETFFRNQISASGHELAYPAVGDFIVDGKWTFEVGGAGKGFGQIANIPGSFLAVDNCEIGRGNRIPLWMFGLLY